MFSSFTCAVKGIFIFYLNVSFFFLSHFRVRQPQKTKKSPSRPLTSLRTYLKSMILTLRLTSRFPTQVSSFCTSSSLRLDTNMCSVISQLFSLVSRRSKVSVGELQRAAGEGRRPPQVPQPGRLQEEEGADLMQPVHHSESTMHV